MEDDQDEADGIGFGVRIKSGPIVRLRTVGDGDA